MKWRQHEINSEKYRKNSGSLGRTKWQLLFAELIVLIQKEFNLHVLLNTHSPYFLRVIQVYSAQYEAADKCK